MTRTAPTAGTFGVSFKDDGGCHWQFVIDAMTDDGARITTFSWIDGDDWSVETVTKEWLANQCILFKDHDAFIQSAEYWGDFHKDRRNPEFATLVSP